jgi:hypothetical protein
MVRQAVSLPLQVARALTRTITMDIEDDKTPLEKLGIEIPNELEGLFGEPSLLDGEDPNLYWGLLAAMIKDRKPQGFPDWIYVYDTVDKFWEEGRLKRASTGLMQGEMFSALMYFLSPIHADGHLKKPGAAEKLAFEFFSDNPKERQEVIALLARYGITLPTLHAKAAQQKSDAIQMFEAMRARRGKERRKLREEDERLRRLQKKTSDGSARNGD